jgi:hypothetical protein
MSKFYWLTPTDVFEKLNEEFHFDFDPCPYPYKNDGITINWGKSNYVNPPFKKTDAINGHGPTAFVRKAIDENKKGKSVVIVVPTPSYVNLLLDAGAEIRSMGRIRWLHVETKEPCKDPSPITAFILRGK